MDRLVATYFVETPLPIDKAAAALANEQSSGTFVEVPGETAELKQRFAARVEKISELETVSTPTLPPGRVPPAKAYHRAQVTLSWSAENFDYNLAAVVASVQGNPYEFAQFTGMKLMDLQLPPSFAAHFRGPAFGVDGTRKLTGVHGRPVMATIIKPSIGLSPGQTADLVKTLVEAGIDFIKDDEKLISTANSHFDERVEAIMAVINAHAQRTGKKAMYAFNISDEHDPMMRHYDKVVASGGTAAMVNINGIGLIAAKRICDRGQLAIHGNRNGWGMLNRHPLLGVDFAAYQVLWRLAGIDHLHVNGIANKFWEPDESVVHSINCCRRPLLGGMSVLPVVSSGQWGGQAPETYRRTQTIDLMYMAGGGIMGHPDGPAAGVNALCKWWEAAVEGLSFEQATAKYPELAKSAAKFGKKA